MGPVGLDIDSVVDQVDPRRGHGEGNDSDEHLQGGTGLERNAGGRRCGEHQNVLDPLTGPTRPNESRHRGA